jgi:hypothetical protein
MSWLPPKNGIVYDPGSQFVEIRKLKEIRTGLFKRPPYLRLLVIDIRAAVLDDYIEYDIASSNSPRGFVDIFIELPESESVGGSSGDIIDEKLFVGRIDLGKLGVKGQLHRRWKRMKMEIVYVTKPAHWGKAGSLREDCPIRSN